MAECLNCHKDLVIEDRHHGTIFTCPHCNAVFFCGWDGSLEMAQHLPEPEIQESSSPAENQNQHSVADSENQIHQPFVQLENQIEDSGFQHSSQAQEPAHNQEPIQNQEVAHSQESHQPDRLAEQEAFGLSSEPHHFESTEASSFAATPSAPISHGQLSVSATSDFSEVTDFANNNEVSLTDVSYRLVIEGIDTAKIHETFVEAITDSRFGWDKNDVLDKIQNGKLELRNLTPAKTSVLVNRIKHLEIVIRWYYES